MNLFVDVPVFKSQNDMALKIGFIYCSVTCFPTEELLIFARG